MTIKEKKVIGWGLICESLIQDKKHPIEKFDFVDTRDKDRLLFVFIDYKNGQQTNIDLCFESEKIAFRSFIRITKDLIRKYKAPIEVCVDVDKQKKKKRK